MSISVLFVLLLNVTLATRVAAQDVKFVDKLRDESYLRELMDEMAEEVAALRGLETGSDLSIDFMDVPDFAYQMYLEDKEDRDERFDTALRLFLFGWAADDRNWTDPDIAAIASSKYVMGQYKPEDRNIIITQNPVGLIGFVNDTLSLLLANNDDKLKAYTLLDRMFSNEDRTSEFAVRNTMFHELVHSAQDWNFNLLQWMDYFDTHNELDLSLAVRALIEGDAEYSSASRICEEMGLKKVLDEAVLENFLKTEDRKIMDKPFLPPILNANDPIGIFYSGFGAFPYQYGFLFNGYIRSAQGLSIDDFYKNAPVTTRQILHPDRDAAGEFSLHVIDFGTIEIDFETMALDSVIEPGNIAIETSVGEFGINSLFSAFGLFKMEDDAAEGWAGDRLRVYMNDDQDIAVFWYSVWDTRADAERFFRAYTEILNKKCSFSIGITSPDNAPLYDKDICGTQWINIVDNAVMVFEVPGKPSNEEVDSLASVLLSAEIQTMPANEYLDWIGFYDDDEAAESDPEEDPLGNE